MKFHRQLLRRPRKLPPMPQPPKGYMFYPGDHTLFVRIETIQRQSAATMDYHDALPYEERLLEHDPPPEFEFNEPNSHYDYDPPEYED